MRRCNSLPIHQIQIIIKFRQEQAMNSPRENPYLSIVTTSRNDDHGGNMLRRMEVSILGRLEQLEKHRIESELILVDWNPPADRPLLKDILQWPEHTKYCTIRVLVVPPSIHQRYEHSDKTPMNMVVAINCGVRRARGQYILPCNIDLLYSDELITHIAARNLKEDERYRIDRCNVDKNVVQCNTLEEQLDYCRSNIIQINGQGPPAKRETLPHLHTNASGDFQLMSRHYWHLLRGYREADIPSAHADGLLSFASYAAGVREVVFKDPLCLYHIDHGGKFHERPRGSRLPFENWLRLPFLPEKLNNFILRVYRILLTTFGYKLKSSENGIPTLHFSEYRKIARDIVAGRRPYIFNDENWGLGQDSLEEYVISAAEWDKEYEKN